MLISTLTARADTLNEDINYLVGSKSTLENSLTAKKERIEEIVINTESLTTSRELFQKASTHLRLQISNRFADLATRALRHIFQREDLKFEVVLDIKSNLPVASFFVLIDGHKVEPKEALGGSIYEVIGVCLRLVCLEVFDLKGPLMLDEPLRSVDDVNLQNALEFILAYCKETGRQLFIVTHNKQIASSADKLFEVTQQNGISIVNEI